MANLREWSLFHRDENRLDMATNWDNPDIPAQSTISNSRVIPDIREKILNLTVGMSEQFVYELYHLCAQRLDRNSPEAILADTKARIRTLTPAPKAPGEKHEEWVEREIIPHLHPDMVSFAYHWAVYRHLDIPVFRAFYYSLANANRPERKVNKKESIVRPRTKKSKE